MSTARYRENLCSLYKTYNHRDFVHPDPLELLYLYQDPLDREIVGLIASSLAYGRVSQIVKAVSVVLERMGAPRVFLSKATSGLLVETFKDFRYRFTTGEELAGVLYGVKLVVEKHGSLGQCFSGSLKRDDENVLPALSAFVGELSSASCGQSRSLLPSPDSGSACKRLNLFLRWMVRRDEVDPGGWDAVPSSKLIVPLDIHMHRLSLRLGLTKRKQANLKAALDVTTAFKRIEPEDPVRYDFSLTRLGIRDDLTPEDFIRACNDICAWGC